MSVFERKADRYDSWFRTNAAAYRSELAAVRAAAGPPDEQGRGLEVGSGTGRFAIPLHIGMGVEPAAAMRRRAAQRGMRPVAGVAEHLPFADDTFDLVLVVTTICFVDDPRACVDEASRVLRGGGRLVIGYIDRDSSLGKLYRGNRDASPFYASAAFFSSAEIEELVRGCGLSGLQWRQTLFGDAESVHVEEPVKEGRDEGSFVVVTAFRGRDGSGAGQE
ncbi:MAG: class I SAM-dependent methyltransferase [Candidatus Fermentibacteraceae bacterium]